MIVAKGTRTVVAWIACLAVLLASLAPTISQAFQGGGVPDSWMEVCSASGSRFVAVGDAGKDSLPAAPVKHLLQHCPYCSLHVTALGMPPTPLSVPALLPLGDAVPELMLQAPRTLFAWASAQPRAPPQFS